MLSTMNLTIINEEELSPLLHTGAPVTSLDRHTGMAVILELTKNPSRSKPTPTEIVDETKATDCVRHLGVRQKKWGEEEKRRGGYHEVKGEVNWGERGIMSYLS